ncbi:putative nicotinate-nucleotide pyrophosphorylase [carboxylating] [subsurface metagenome]
MNKIIIRKKIQEFLEEDCLFQDVSSEIIPENKEIKAQIIAKSSGYVSGLKEIDILFEFLNVKITLFKKDGDKVVENDIICVLSGNAHDILFGERTSLNLLTRMSAITSSTRDFVNITKKLNKYIKIACTRKTTPYFRIFEKRAVKLGGGETHRWNLDDMILIKDTHLKYFSGDVKKILKKTRELASFSKKIEIEVENIENILIAARNGADIIMLDNMKPAEIEEAIKSLEMEGLREKVLLEASGSINKENIEEYVKTGVDIISLGSLTQFPHKQVDFSLKLI